MEQKLLGINFIFIKTKRFQRIFPKELKIYMEYPKEILNIFQKFNRIEIFQNSSLTQKLHVHKEIWTLYIIVWPTELLVLEGTLKIICHRAAGGIWGHNIRVSKAASNTWLMKQ